MRRGQRARSVKLKRFVMRNWPLTAGVETLMHLLALPEPEGEFAVCRLRGFPLQLKFKPTTYMGRYLYYRGMYEDGVIRALGRLLRPGMVFADAGANIGLHSVVAAHLVGPAGRVVAFEPQEELAQLVRLNATLNGLENIVVETIALGRAAMNGLLYQPSMKNDGQATLSVGPGERYVGKPRPVRIESLGERLSALGIIAADGLKIDVEGAELEVLQGLLPFVGSRPPRFVLFECNPDLLARFGASPQVLLSYLWQCGYEIRHLAMGLWRSSGPGEWNKGHIPAGDYLAVRSSGA